MAANRSMTTVRKTVAAFIEFEHDGDWLSLEEFQRIVPRRQTSVSGSAELGHCHEQIPVAAS